MQSRTNEANKNFRISIAASILVNLLVLCCVGGFWLRSLANAPQQPSLGLVRLVDAPQLLPMPTAVSVTSKPMMTPPAAHEAAQASAVKQPHVRFAFRRSAHRFSREVARLSQGVPALHPEVIPSGGANAALAAPSTAINPDTEARHAEAVAPTMAITPQVVAAAPPVLTTNTSSPTAPIVAAPAPMQQTGPTGTSLQSATNGTGNGVGTAGNSIAGQGTGAGAGSGTGNGEGAGSGGDNGGGGGPFGIGGGAGSSGGPRHIVYCLDCSPSMTSRTTTARQELKDALQGLQNGESFDIICFAGDTTVLFPALTAATPYEIGQADYFLQNAPLRPGTNIEQAMQLALSITGVNAVVLITDGVPTQGEQNFDKLAAKIDRSNVDHARIYTVGLVGKNPDGTDDTFQATNLLAKIAQDSGGDSKVVTCGINSPD